MGASVGISPRSTQRLFEAAPKRAVLAGREYAIPDAKVEDVCKREVIGEVPVPTL